MAHETTPELLAEKTANKHRPIKNCTARIPQMTKNGEKLVILAGKIYFDKNYDLENFHNTGIKL